MEFDEYLAGKKIDPTRFKKGDEELYSQLKTLFDQVHPNSFTQQKLFLINKTRRKFQLTEEKTEKPKPSSAKMKPKVLPRKPKI